MTELRQADVQNLAGKLRREILDPLKETFVGKDEIIDLLGLCLVARENLFLLGPPGTAKSALVQQLAKRIGGRVFDYLLTRFTEPNEIFGPFDIRKLREGELETNVTGMLPEADFVFLDELLNANSAILNSLLLALNERVFRRGRESFALPTLMVVGASNHLPEDEALGALFDRFLVRVRCDNVGDDGLNDVLKAGWSLGGQRSEEAVARTVTVDDLRNLHGMVQRVDLTPVRDAYADLVRSLRKAGLNVSDRRAVKFQSLLAASALLSGRVTANLTDAWVLRYTWDQDEEREIIAALVDQAMAAASEDERLASHPRARVADAPDPEALAADLQTLATSLTSATTEGARSELRDRLALLTSRAQWITDTPQRTHLEETLARIWQQMESDGR